MHEVDSLSRRLFAPLLTSQAGACLTMDNWREIGIEQGVFSLETLIAKPGIEVLKSFRDLRHYSGWRGRIILNATLKTKASTGEYEIRSPYDGRLIHLSHDDLIALVRHLNPDVVIWPDKTEPPGFECIESDKPAADALQGIIYTQTGTFNLLDEDNREAFSALDAECDCPTCRAGYTRAYLHHLLQHTPLLAQRFLMMHNVARICLKAS